ncbi:hypothetical protein DL765_006811 [Monosporascus sp. GIB2]|nr:hypothetical protein DL765_006811 [Monosporascus sp. GIB2]
MDLRPRPARGDNAVGEAVRTTKLREVVGATSSTWPPTKASTTVAAKEVPPTPGESEKTVSHFEATTASGENIYFSPEIPANKEPHDTSQNANPDSSRGERPHGVRWRSQEIFGSGSQLQVPNIERKHSTGAMSVDNPSTSVNEVLKESAPGSRAKIPENDYNLKTLWSPDSTRHYLDIVAVHDFDETTASWTYKDISGLLRQGVEDPQKKTHGVGEESEESSPESDEDRPLDATTPKADPLKHKRDPPEGDPTMTVDSVPDSHGEIHEPENSRPMQSGSRSGFSPTRRIAGTNWLKDPQMIPKLLPGARILAFSYPRLKPKSIGNKGEPAEYIDNAALGLRGELEKARPSIDYDNIPIVFIAAGFGGMIVQKAITMAATPNNTSNDGPSSGAADMTTVPEESSLGLDHLANVVFLDTPFPKTSKGLAFEKGAFSSPIYESFTLLNYFVVKLPKRPEAQGLQAIALHPICWTDLRRLTNFPGPNDSGYRHIATHIRSDLMFTAVRNRKFQKLQAGLVKSGATVDNKDEWGSSLLHRATAAVNVLGVRILLRSHANPVIRDSEGQTPLHCAVNLFRLACDCKTDDTIPGVKERKELEDIIRVLLDSTPKSELRNSNDKQGNLPQDLLYHEDDSPCPSNTCKHSEILELFKYHQPKVSRRLGEFEEPWRAWNPPQNEVQHAACKGSRTIVAEFYQDQSPPEYEVPSVNELIYQPDKGPAIIFENLAGLKRRALCRWIHLPANNVRPSESLEVTLLTLFDKEQWIHSCQDLFIRMRLENRSMVGQRNNGSTVFNRYMVAQAKRYRQKTFDDGSSADVPRSSNRRAGKIPKAPVAIEPRAARSGGFKEFAEKETIWWTSYIPHWKRPGGSSDTIVLFMPVLAFERHRSRKLMSSAILKAMGSQERRMPHGSWLGSRTLASLRREHDKRHRARIVIYKWTRTEQIRRRKKRASRPPTWSDENDDEIHAQSDQNSGAGEHDRHSAFSLKAKHRPIIMVDQLWLWILPDGTIVTSLPNTEDASQLYNIKHSLEAAFFDNKSNSPIQSTNDLVKKVLITCAETEMNLYQQYSKKVSELEKHGSSALKKENLIDSFSQIKQETDRLREIMDIQDELSIVDSILATQKVTLETLRRDVLGRGDGGKPAKAPKPDSNEDDPETAKTATPDSSCVQQAVRIVEANIKSVLEMKNSASRVQADLKQLLDFKQQQANALETRFSRRLAEQGQKQNRIMLVFTIVTIVFLPLSFFASFFALNVHEFPKNSLGNTDWPLGTVASYLFGISIAIFVIVTGVIVFSRNPTIRKTKKIIRKSRRRHLENPPPLGGEVVDSESDESDSSDDEGARPGRKPDNKLNYDASSSTSSRRSTTVERSIDEEDDEYARFFGLRGFTLHTKIPLVRRLWEYSIYHDTEFDQLDSGLEPYDWDYPLNRWYKKNLRFINKIRRRTNFGALQGIEATSREAVLRMLQFNDEIDDVIRVLQEEPSEVSVESIGFSVVDWRRQKRPRLYRESGFNHELPGPSTPDASRSSGIINTAFASTANHEPDRGVISRLSSSFSHKVAGQASQQPTFPSTMLNSEPHMIELRAALSSYIATQEESVRLGRTFLDVFAKHHSVPRFEAQCVYRRTEASAGLPQKSFEYYLCTFQTAPDKVVGAMVMRFNAKRRHQLCLVKAHPLLGSIREVNHAIQRKREVPRWILVGRGKLRGRFSSATANLREMGWSAREPTPDRSSAELEEPARGPRIITTQLALPPHPDTVPTVEGTAAANHRGVQEGYESITSLGLSSDHSENAAKLPLPGLQH